MAKLSPLSFHYLTATMEDNNTPPAQSLTPKVTEEQTRKMLKDKYHMRALTLKPLNGYDDKNFHATMDSVHDNPYVDQIPSEGYFVKISNLVESNLPDILHAQLAQMKHLTERGIPCQSSVKNIDGDELTDFVYTEDDGTEVVYKLSVRVFLPGQILDNINMTPKFVYDLGVFVAKVTQAFEDFHSPHYDSHEPRWSLNNVLEVGKIIHVIKDDKRRETCAEVLKAFEERVIPARSEFRKGQVHGDLNEQNILVAQDAESKDTLEITGLLDFQDSARSYSIYDLALCTAYMMMLQKLQCPRMDAPGHMLAGYTSVIQLTGAETKLFKELLAARMVQSLAYGVYTHYLEPSNEYALTTGKAGWDALITLWDTPTEEASKRWQDIVKSYKD